MKFILTSGSGIWPIIWLLTEHRKLTVEKKNKTNLEMVRVEMMELKLTYSVFQKILMKECCEMSSSLYFRLESYIS